MSDFSLPRKCILAPMAGLTDAAFREQCKEFGAALVVTELTSVEGIVRKEDELQDVLDVQEGELPSVQLFGTNIDAIIKAAKIVEPLASVIDFNLGCPAPHITAQEAGSALLMKPEHLKEIFTELKKHISLPITAKIRLGPTDKQLVYKEVAKTLEESGVDLITLHARTVKQGYSGKADWSKIKDLVELLSIPVCGNGDITTPEEAKRMMDETGCQYIMIGRGAAGNPFIFKQCNDYFATGTYETPTQEDIIKAFTDYLEKAQKYKIKFSRMKSMAMQYSHGLEKAKEKRKKIALAKSVVELRLTFDS